MSPHINASLDQIAPFVLLSGDPNRTTKMSLKFLKNPKLVNGIRNMVIYTGYYKGMKISFATSGIGFSSTALYLYELYKFYQVKVIIRMGTCGVLNEKNKLLDTLNVKMAWGIKTFLNDFHLDSKTYPHFQLWSYLKNVAQKEKISLFSDTQVLSDENFYFQDVSKMIAMKKIYNLDAVEMEAYILFLYAKLFHAAAACLLTITDILELEKTKKGYKVIEKVSPQKRVVALSSMFRLALETCLLWKKQKMK